MLEDIRAEARRINVPTLVLSGDKDQVEAPEAVAQAIRHFVSLVPVSDPPPAA
jgi:pimeloyl-ACP methyl ester carboxylesterase